MRSLGTAYRTQPCHCLTTWNIFWSTLESVVLQYHTFQFQMFTIMSCWKPTDATYFRLGEKACKQHKRSKITRTYNDKVPRRKTSILIIKEPLKRGGGGVCEMSQFQNPTFHTSRRKPCPYYCFTTLLFVNAFLHCRNFKPSMYHFVTILCFNYVGFFFSTHHLSEFCPNRTSLMRPFSTHTFIKGLTWKGSSGLSLRV